LSRCAARILGGRRQVGHNVLMSPTLSRADFRKSMICSWPEPFFRPVVFMTRSLISFSRSTMCLPDLPPFDPAERFEHLFLGRRVEYTACCEFLRLRIICAPNALRGRCQVVSCVPKLNLRP